MDPLPDPPTLSWRSVFGADSSPDHYLSAFALVEPVTFFVGPNGSGKSRTTNSLIRDWGGHRARHLSTDRLAGLMGFTHYGWMSVPSQQARGLPVGGTEEEQTRALSYQHGIISDAFYVLRERPDILLRVSALLARVFGRVLNLTEQAGFINPTITTHDSSYSLLNEEGHGLRELVALLTFTYFDDRPILVVDEPELHLHPSLARFWLEELKRELVTSGRRALIVTHEPRLIRPKGVRDLAAIYLFREGQRPVKLSEATEADQEGAVEGSLKAYPELVADLVFSPRAVLVEGVHDRAALEAAMRRQYSSEVWSQTDFIPCGGTSAVAAWFEIAQRAGVDVRAVADLDALFDRSFQRSMDRQEHVTALYGAELLADPPRTSVVLRDLHEAAAREQIGTSAKEKAIWLAGLGEDRGGLFYRKKALLESWRAAGIWLHPQGTLEAVLGLTDKASVETARDAGEASGLIDQVADFAAYDVDLSRTMLDALLNEVRRIAQAVQREQARDPDRRYEAPVAGAGSFDAALVDIAPAGALEHRLTIRSPPEYKEYWMEFSAETPVTEMQLRKP